jgi:hypothetical protein
MSNSRPLQAMPPCALTRPSSPAHSPTSQPPAVPVSTGFPCTLPLGPSVSARRSSRRHACSVVRGTGKHLGRLPLGETLGVQFAILYKQVRAFETSLALVAIIVATLLLLDYRFHRDLLFQPLALTYGWLRMAR